MTTAHDPAEPVSRRLSAFPRAKCGLFASRAVGALLFFGSGATAADANDGPVAAGPALQVTAHVETLEGGEPKTKVQQFVWELIQTSREPGGAMNFPVNAADR
jgi:hypothetical protein